MAFALKRVNFEGRAEHIVCQCDNGPCPLIAIVNILLLERRATLEPTTIARHFVTIDELVQLVAEVLLTAGISQTPSEGRQVQVNSVLELLPSLSRGLDLNIFFNHCRGFEYTSALDVFDSLGIGLVHGWLVDPQMIEVVQAMQGMSYNQVMFELAAARTEHPTPPVAAAAAAAAAAGAGTGTGKGTVEAAAAQASPPPSPAAPSPRLQRVRVLEEFLRDSASQLSYHGLAQLYAALEKGGLSVLFRNNHFAVILRRHERLFLLVTDAGFVDNEDIVWEGLDVSDSAFYDSSFRPSGNGSSSSSVVGSSSSSVSRVAVQDINFDSVLRPGAARDDVDASERLARQLEREDADRALAQRLHQQQQQTHNHHQQQPHSQYHHQQQQQQQYQQYAQQNQNWTHLSYPDWRAQQPPPPKPAADSSGGCVAQ